MIFNFAQRMTEVGRLIFPIVSPLIGDPGTFSTGKNTSSNFLFGTLQMNTFELF